MGLGAKGDELDDDGVAPPVDRPFHEGTADNPQIGIVVNSTGNAVRLFQLGDPTRMEDIALGASTAVTPVSMAISDTRLAVPLGNAGSVAARSSTASRCGCRRQRCWANPQ